MSMEELFSLLSTFVADYKKAEEMMIKKKEAAQKKQ